MIRAGYDYEGFRKQRHLDEFRWPDDPLRGLNEAGADRDVNNRSANVNKKNY